MKANQMTEDSLPYSHKGDLTTGSVRRHILRLTIPMIWGIFSIISLQLADTYFISLLGTRELAGISFTFPVTMLLSHLVFGFNVAISSVVSRLIGQKNTADAKRVTLHAIILAFGVSAFVSLLCYVFMDPIFRLLGADAQTLPVIHDYMPLWLIGSAVIAITVNGNSAIRAGGDTFWPSLVMVGMAALNVVLAPILIFGHFGAPAMGVFGAALSTLISQVIAVGAGLYILIGMKDFIPRDGLHLDRFKDSFKRLIVIAAPAGITNTIGPITNAIILALLAKYGDEAVAAFGVATRVEAFALLFVIALSLGLSPVVGQNWGARIHGRAKEAIDASILYNMAWSLSIALLLALFAKPIASEFSADPAVVNYTTLFFWIVPFSYGFGNLVFGWSAAFNAMGMPQKSFVMIVVKSFVITIPVVFLLDGLFGLEGIFAAMAVSNLSAGLLFHGLSRRALNRLTQAPLSVKEL